MPMRQFDWEAVPPLLLDWYDQNARVLPWRENADPYRVWVSEIMLQQTRVEAAKPYFDRFVRELPTLQALAEAPEAALMKLWEGLGYYTRARNLQKAAQAVMELHGGQFPTNYTDILALPGVGGYTAGAVCSIALGLPTPAVDGNVLRVAARLAGDGRDVALPAVKAEVTAALAAVYPPRRCGDFTQSLMELGALVCLPNGATRCGDCPLAELCTAFAEGRQQELPVKAPKKPRRKEIMTVLLLTCGDRMAVRQRAATGLLAGLWEFPHLPGTPTQDEVLAVLAEWGLAPLGLAAGPKKGHIFTHLEWEMYSFGGQCSRMDNRFCWATREMLEHELSLPTAFKQWLAVVGKI